MNYINIIYFFKRMVMGLKHGLMVQNMREVIKWVENMVMVNFYGQMDQLIKENFLIIM